MKLSGVGLSAIKQSLSVIRGDRLWLKFGHGRFVLLRRDGDTWRAHHTRLEISKADCKKQGYGEKVRSQSRSIAFDGRADGLAELLRISKIQDGGIFWVPAGNGADLPLKDEIAQSDHIGCEIDNAARSEQLERYRWFERISGLEYGLQLSSGSKSIHSHLFLDRPATIGEVVRLRRLFVLCLLGDPAVTRPHQPMRFPGFYRREQGSYQALLKTSSSRYSLAEVERGLRAAFTALGWTYPENISGEFWADLQRALKTDLPAAAQRARIGELLQRGEQFYIQQRDARAQRQRQYAQKQLSGEFNLFEAVQQIEGRLSVAEAFNPAHDWNFSGNNHARGHCQWHSSQSNSAWLSQKNGNWVYHCPTCTDDKPLGAFQYWLADRRGPSTSMPTGAMWAAAAKEWLSLHGVAVPVRTAPTRPGQTTGEKPLQQTKKAWLQQQEIERNHRAYTKVGALLEINLNLDTDRKDYKKRARVALYQPLKQKLKYEVRGPLVSGFASEIKPAAAGRSLIAYNCSQGTGKSNNALIPPALRVAKGGGRVLIIVPTRGLAKEFKGRINERAGAEIAATHLDSNAYSAAIVVSCPESVYKFKGQTFNLIQVDEANEVLHRIESAELGNAGPQSLAAFRKLLATTPVVEIATAAMSGWTLAAMQTIGGFTPDETQVQSRSRPATDMKIVKYSDFHHWLYKIIEALRSGQRIAIPTGSRGKGRMIDRVLGALFPDQNGLVIDGASTLQNQRSQFLADPDAFLTTARPDWFIFTPVINSGVSIEGQHFDIQFEYASPNEGAQSISQRGERIRAAIGRDGTIVERHIYFSDCGTPTLEAYPDAFDWQYWANELADESSAPVGAATALAKALGAEKALNPLKQETEKFTAMRPHLPHLMAIKAFEIIFRKELLAEDWARYGWEVAPAPALDLEQSKQRQQLQVFCEKVQIGLIEQQGRTLKKTRTRASESELDEISNPFQATRASKLNLERLLGKDYLLQQDSQFFTAWSADKSANNPGIHSVVRSQLLSIALSDPECWQQIERMKALKFLAGKPEVNAGDEELFWHLPALPAAARDIELTSIIARCPGIAEVVSRKLEHWTNADPQIVAGGLYLISHAKQIAANTKRRGLTKGAKFSEQMAPTALFNKALELMGYRPQKEKRAGSGARLNIYRLKVTADAVAVLQRLQQRGKDGMKLFRAELEVVRAQSRHSIDAAARHRIIKQALDWVTDKSELNVKKAIAAIRQRHANSIDQDSTKLGDASILDAEKLLKSPNQMALLSTKLASLPPPLRNG